MSGMVMRVFVLCVMGMLSLSTAHALPPLQHAPMKHALAMHGEPKYPNGFQHVDYVNPNAPKGGVLKRADIGTFDNLNNFLLMGKAPTGLNLTYDTLMQRAWNEPFTMYGLVAKSIRVADDRSWIIFYLNPNARFHDGAPILAKDVIFTAESLRQYGRPNQRAVYKLIDKITQIDQRTVRFDLGKGYNRETVMIIAMMPVLSSKYWAERDFSKTTLTPPLGSGPYRIASVDAGRRIIYDRVTDYWAKDLPINVGHYNFDRIIYDYYRDDHIALQAFGAGAYDVRIESSPMRWRRNYNFTGVTDGTIIKRDIETERPQWARFITFNMRRAPFDNRDVRRALILAFDFEWINKALFQNAYKRTQSVFPNAPLAHHGIASAGEQMLLKPYLTQLPNDIFNPYIAPQTDGTGVSGLRPNLRQAVALLDQAGWHMVDGVMVHKETKQPLTFQIILNDPLDERIALEYSRALRRIGIRMTLRTVDTAQYMGRMGDFDFDATFSIWKNSLSPGTEQAVYWGSRAAQTPGSFNYSGLQSRAVDDLIDRLVRVTDYQQLTYTAQALDRVIMHEAIGVPLYYAPYDMVAYRYNLVLPDKTPIFGSIVETWWARDAESTPQTVKKK
jgi:microcin C transport system substrate-binding protein